MLLKPIIQGLAAVWLMLFVVSFIALQVTDTGEGETSGLNRLVQFLTWQAAALTVAVIGASATRFAVQRGTEGIKMFGYVPLALSVFLVGSFIALMGFRLFVAPLFA